MARRSRWAALIGTGILGAATIAPGLVRAADPVAVTFTATGAEQQWIVPDGVTSIDVVAIGGPAGSGYHQVIPAAGGNGARVEGTLAVTAGATLIVTVGGAGANGTAFVSGAGGFNGGAAGGTIIPSTFSYGGGGGGGASDIRTTSRTEVASLASRAFVAAGGGGGGGGFVGTRAGGNAGTHGAAGDEDFAAWGGTEGTAGAGGIGGRGGPRGDWGADGTIGAGGAGGTGNSSPGGGGGGGLYGGGGGGGGHDGGGGGGGGSSTVGSLTDATIAVDSTRVPSITITYTPGGGGGNGDGGNDSGVVDAVVTIPSSAACLELSTTSIGFGTVPLGATGVQATPDVQVTNCSGNAGFLYARGSDATGTDASWTLDDTGDTCGGAPALALDRYHLYANQTALSGQNKGIADLTAGSELSVPHFIDTACPGSTGAGTTMSLQVTYLITE